MLYPNSSEQKENHATFQAEQLAPSKGSYKVLPPSLPSTVKKNMKTAILLRCHTWSKLERELGS
jgi:hypothetical protein